MSDIRAVFFICRFVVEEALAIVDSEPEEVRFPPNDTRALIFNKFQSNN
jgi:hypothetical protein